MKVETCCKDLVSENVETGTLVHNTPSPLYRGAARMLPSVHHGSAAPPNPAVPVFILPHADMTPPWEAVLRQCFDSAMVLA